MGTILEALRELRNIKTKKVNETSDWGWTEQRQQEFEKELAELKARRTELFNEQEEAQKEFFKLKSEITSLDSYVIKKLKELKPEWVEKYQEYSKTYNELTKDLEVARNRYHKIDGYSANEWDPEGTVGGARYRSELLSKYYTEMETLEKKLKELADNSAELVDYIKEFKDDYYAASQVVQRSRTNNGPWREYISTYGWVDPEVIRKVYGDEAAAAYSKFKSKYLDHTNLSHNLMYKHKDKEKAINTSKYNMAISDTPIGQLDPKDIDQAVSVYLIKNYDYDRYDPTYVDEPCNWDADLGNISINIENANKYLNQEEIQELVQQLNLEESNNYYLFFIKLGEYEVTDDKDWEELIVSDTMLMKDFTNKVSDLLYEVLDEWWDNGHDFFYEPNNDYDPY